jgi:putative ABC transport system substrate-binding protein
MKRLAIVVLMLATPAAAETATGKVWRLGELAPSAESLEITRSFTLPELARLGFREGENLVVDHRAGDAAALPELARDVVLAKPDAIIAIGPDSMRAAAAATSTIPIVTFGTGPVQLGLAASLAHPGGNVTGVVILGEKLDGKRLDVLHEAVPAARRVAALLLPSQPNRSGIERDMRALAAANGIELFAFEATGPDDYEPAFAAMRAAKAQALVITGSATFNREMSRCWPDSP